MITSLIKSSYSSFVKNIYTRHVSNFTPSAQLTGVYSRFYAVKNGNKSENHKEKVESHHIHHEEIATQEPIVGPGAPIGTIGTVFEQSSGLERLEYLADSHGINIFLTEPLKIDAYGTLDKPVLVETIEGTRIVGCTGFPKYSHEVLWMKMQGETIRRCVDCGQAFQLTPAAPINLEEYLPEAEKDEKHKL